MPNAPSKQMTLQWIGFVLSYWHLLDKEQREAYIVDMMENIAPPKLTLDEMTDIEVSALRQHQGKVLQAYRKEANMTLEEVAGLIEKQKAYLSLIESGKRTLTVVDMYRIMNALSIPSQEMFALKVALPEPVKASKG